MSSSADLAPVLFLDGTAQHAATPPSDRVVGAPCPKCGSEVLAGYGLAGGGMGAYEVCNNGDCDFFVKTQDAGEP